MEFDRKREKIRKIAAAKITRSGVNHARINHDVPLTGLHNALSRGRRFCGGGGMNWANLPSPPPSPHGRGSSAVPVVKAFPLQPHPLADAATKRCKLAKASLRGEGQGEGSDASSFRYPRTAACARAGLAALYGNWTVWLVGRGMLRTAARIFVSLMVLAFAGGAAMAAKRVALVIGNSAYTNAPALANPKNDAQDMAAALKALGFTVILGTDLDKRAMDRKILEFSNALSGADAGVFHYSGHGLQVAGVNYLVPIDAALDSAAALDFEAVRLDLVQRTMEREAKTNILFLDACRNNPLTAILPARLAPGR